MENKTNERFGGNQIENHMSQKVCNGSSIELSFKSTEIKPFLILKKILNLHQNVKRKVKVTQCLFLTVGSMDKAKKKDIIHFCGLKGKY